MSYGRWSNKHWFCSLFYWLFIAESRWDQNIFLHAQYLLDGNLSVPISKQSVQFQSSVSVKKGHTNTIRFAWSHKPSTSDWTLGYRCFRVFLLSRWGLNSNLKRLPMCSAFNISHWWAIIFFFCWQFKFCLAWNIQSFYKCFPLSTLTEAPDPLFEMLSCLLDSKGQLQYGRI